MPSSNAVPHCNIHLDAGESGYGALGVDMILLCIQAAVFSTHDCEQALAEQFRLCYSTAPYLISSPDKHRLSFPLQHHPIVSIAAML